MRRIKKFLLRIAFFVVALPICIVVICLMTGNEEAVLPFLNLFWLPIKEWFLEDTLLKIVLIIVFSLGLYGTFRLSKRQEAKILQIVSLACSIISFIGLFI